MKIIFIIILIMFSKSLYTYEIKVIKSEIIESMDIKKYKNIYNNYIRFSSVQTEEIYGIRFGYHKDLKILSNGGIAAFWHIEYKNKREGFIVVQSGLNLEKFLLGFAVAHENCHLKLFLERSKLKTDDKTEEMLCDLHAKNLLEIKGEWYNNKDKIKEFIISLGPGGITHPTREERIKYLDL